MYTIKIFQLNKNRDPSRAERYGSSFMTSYNKEWSLVYTVRQLLSAVIERLFWHAVGRSCIGPCRCGEVAVTSTSMLG